MLHKRASPTERVYHKVVEPSLGSFRAVPLTSHSCLRYQPALLHPKSAPAMLSSLELESQAATEPIVTALPKIQVSARMTRSALEIGGNQLIPIYQPQREDVVNLQKSASSNSFPNSSSSVPWTFHSTTKVKQLPLPQVKNQELMRSSSPRGLKNVTISGDRYLGSSVQQPQRAGVSRSYPQFESPPMPKKEQVKRYEEEQHHKYHTRTLKRKSEILSHRVDRMYYLCGSGLSVSSKYDVDEAELERLRELSRSRNNSRANSGRYSARSGRSYTESSIASEGKGWRSPRGSPRATEHSSASSRPDDNVELSVQGSGVSQESDESKGQRSNKELDKTSVAEDGGISQSTVTDEKEAKDGEDGSPSNNNENNKEHGQSSNDAKHSDSQKTSPHRTAGEESGTFNKGGSNDGQNRESGRGDADGNDPKNDEGSRDEKKNMSSNDPENNLDGSGVQNERSSDSETNLDGSGIKNERGDRLGENEGRNDERTEGQEERGEGKENFDGGSSASRKGDGDEQQETGGTGDGGAARGRGGVGRGGMAGREGGDVAIDGSHGNGADVDGSGDASVVEEQKKTADVEGEDEREDPGGNGPQGKKSESASTKINFVESIAPGWNLDKTPVSMKKSDVFMTDFGNPHLANAHGNIDLAIMGTGDHSNGYMQLSEQEREIERMEERLHRVNVLTQEVEGVGHLDDSEIDPSEIGVDWDDPNAKSYDAGVFAKVKSKEDQERVQQFLRERQELKSSKAATAAKALEEKQMAEIAQAKKKAAPPLKYKIATIYNFISNRQREIFTHKFRELDIDGNGVITLKELTKRMHKWVPKDDIKHIMKVFDLNKDKTIDQREFVTVAALNDKLTGKEIASEDAPLELHLNKLLLHITAYKEMFEAVDQNQDGRLSMEEIMLIVSLSVGVEIGTDKEVVKHIRDTIDTDSNGTIDFIEFLSYIPFFLKIHRDIIGRPISIDEIEKARVAVKEALGK